MAFAGNSRSHFFNENRGLVNPSCLWSSLIDRNETMPRSKVTALIVEDNTHMLRLLAAMVRAFGIDEVMTVGDAVEGLEILKTNPIDLAIVDFKLPVLDGLEFTEMVRKSPDSANPFLPIIMVSAYAERSRIIAARDAGVNEFCAKPINAQTLFSRLQSVVNKPRAFINSPTYFGPDRRRKHDPHYRGPERRADQLQDDDESWEMAAATNLQKTQ